MVSQEVSFPDSAPNTCFLATHNPVSKQLATRPSFASIASLNKLAAMYLAKPNSKIQVAASRTAQRSPSSLPPKNQEPSNPAGQ